jgi:CHAD domain-containing protein
VDNRDGVLNGRNNEPLHEVRVSIRRFRVLLRALRPCFKDAYIEKLQAAVSALSKRCGAARDMDVWLAFLHEQADAGRPAWRLYLKSQARIRNLRYQALRRLFRGRPYGRLMAMLAQLLRAELPDVLRRQRRSEPFVAFACGRLARLLAQVSNQLQTARPSLPDEYHALRRACRKARYWAEFTAPLLGSPGRDLVRRLHAAANVLGNLHDMDVALERIKCGPTDFPSDLAGLVIKTRRGHLDDFQEVRAALLDQGFQMRARRALAEKTSRR